MKKQKVDTPRKGSWAERANEPIPEHVKEFHANKNPLHRAVRLGPIDPKYARIFNG